MRFAFLLAFALMAVSAVATAGSAYILGQVINQAFFAKAVRREFIYVFRV